eukprot:TRINITY_DN12549_c0_g1_i9.p1 TRINITY_DN12549_c0_g1~~TRINITY_DN12549_c0_g1_i9.p1  ORF type:complete len:269 (-),score=94.83 TRINITY_DN12549_c0_g1_i9:99-905(-)
MEVVTKKIEDTITTIDTANKTLDNDNFSLMSKATRYKQQIEAMGEKYSEQIDSLENKNFVLTNLLDKQNHVIKSFEAKLNESKRTEKPVAEKLVTDPDQQNAMLQRELEIHRRNFKKLSKGLNAEINKNAKLESYSRALQVQNNFLADAIRKICDNPDSIFSYIVDTEIPELNAESLKNLLEENIKDPTAPQEENEDDLDEEQKNEDLNLSIASSIGARLPVKNDLCKTHEKIKLAIPALDFSKLEKHRVPPAKLEVKKTSKSFLGLK